MCLRSRPTWDPIGGCPDPPAMPSDTPGSAYPLLRALDEHEAGKHFIMIHEFLNGEDVIKKD